LDLPQKFLQPLPVRHLLPRLVVRAGVADGGVQLRPLLGLVLGLEQMPHGAEPVGVTLAGFYAPVSPQILLIRDANGIS